MSKTLNCMCDPMKVVTFGVDAYNQSATEEVSKSLTGAATDSDHVPCCFGLDRAALNQGENAHYSLSFEEDLAQTIVARGAGGGTNPEIVGTLCADDSKGINNQYVTDGKCIIQYQR